MAEWWLAAKFVDRLRTERVENLWPIDDDGRDAAVAFNQQILDRVGGHGAVQTCRQFSVFGFGFSVFVSGFTFSVGLMFSGSVRQTSNNREPETTNWNQEL